MLTFYLIKEVVLTTRERKNPDAFYKIGLTKHWGLLSGYFLIQRLKYRILISHSLEKSRVDNDVAI